MKAQNAAEFAAVCGPALLEPVEDRELMPAHFEGVERLAQALARHSGDTGEQDPAAGSSRRSCSLLVSVVLMPNESNDKSMTFYNRL